LRKRNAEDLREERPSEEHRDADGSVIDPRDGRDKPQHCY